MVGFLLLGGTGLLLLVVGIAADLSGTPGLDHLGVAHDVVLLPVLGAVLASFGLGAALLVGTTSLTPGPSALGGAGAALLIGRLAVALGRAMLHVDSPSAASAAELRGSLGTVVTGIPPQGVGEVSVRFGGHLHKLAARADERLPVGAQIAVLDVLSPTCVRVRRVQLDLG